MQRYECVYLHECAYIFITEKCATSKYIQINDQKIYSMYRNYGMAEIYTPNISFNVETYHIMNLNNKG